MNRLLMISTWKNCLWPQVWAQSHLLVPLKPRKSLYQFELSHMPKCCEGSHIYLKEVWWSEERLNRGLNERDALISNLIYCIEQPHRGEENISVLLMAWVGYHFERVFGSTATKQLLEHWFLCLSKPNEIRYIKILWSMIKAIRIIITMSLVMCRRNETF